MAKSKHFLALDGLRGVAALIVVIGHTFKSLSYIDAPPFPHFMLAVDFFFILSGFVIAHAYERRLEAGMAFADFLRVRTIRLFPLIVLGSILGFGVHAAYRLLSDHQAIELGYVARAVAGALMIPWPSLAPNTPVYPLNGPAWSLLPEIAVNIAYAAFLPRLTTRFLVATSVAAWIALAIFAAAHGDIEGGSSVRTIPIGFLRVLFAFPVGIILQRLYQAGRLANIKAPGALLVAALAATLCFPSKAFTGAYELLVVTIAFPLIVAAGANVVSSGAWAAAWRYAGRLSYPIYILHFPIVLGIANFPPVADGQVPLFAAVAICLLASGAVAHLATALYDEPVRNYLSGRRARPTAAVSSGG